MGLASIVPGMLLSFLICTSTARAEFIEYYNYVIDEEGDTTVVIVAAFDTNAMQLRGEIQQSPLGSAVTTSALVDHGGGFITGSVIVSVTDGGSQYITFKSHIELLPLFEPTHMDTLDADFDFPSIGGMTPAGTNIGEDFIDADVKITTTYNGETGEKETTGELTASTQLTSSTKISLTEKTTATESGTSTETYLKADLTLEDGSITTSFKAKHEEDEYGNKTVSAEGGITFSGKNLELEFTGGVETDGGGPTEKFSGSVKYKPYELLGLRFSFTFRSDDVKKSGTVGLTLDYRPTSYITLFIGIYYNSVGSLMNSEFGWTGSPFPPDPRKGVPVINVASPRETYFYGDVQSTYCCPDTNACVDQPLLQKRIAAGNCVSCDVTYRCSFQPSDSSSFTESLSLKLTRPPKPRTKHHFRYIPTAEGVKSPHDDPPVGRYVSTSPNPFNPDTRITFETATEELVTVQIYDVSGRRVRTLTSRVYPPGQNHVAWDGRDDSGKLVAGGMYFVALRGKEWQATGRALFLK
jgi:hypothetical protein